MKQFAVVIFILLLSQSCNNSNSTDTSEMDGIHKVVVEEVLQTSQYTYLLTKKDAKDFWLAIPSTLVETGATYYHTDGMLMTNFTSKELNRSFDEILFLEEIFSNPPVKKEHTHESGEQHTGSVTAAKREVSVSVAEGGISIADLYAKKENYAGKKVKVSGEVVKFNPEIMGFNWIHLQDGTDFEGHFDLTVTTNAVVANGDIVTFEGVVVLNKDFGFGYFYDLLMEEGVIIK